MESHDLTDIMVEKAHISRASSILPVFCLPANEINNLIFELRAEDVMTSKSLSLVYVPTMSKEEYKAVQTRSFGLPQPPSYVVKMATTKNQKNVFSKSLTLPVYKRSNADGTPMFNEESTRRALMDLDASVKHRSGHELDLQSIVHLRSAGYVVDRNTGLSSVSLSPQRIDDKSNELDGLNATLRFEMLLPNESFQYHRICNHLPTQTSHPIYQKLTGKQSIRSMCGDNSDCMGYLHKDHTNSLVLVGMAGVNTGILPLAGIWVHRSILAFSEDHLAAGAAAPAPGALDYNIAILDHPMVWAMCVRFAVGEQSTLSNRQFLSTNTFILAIVGPDGCEYYTVCRCGSGLRSTALSTGLGESTGSRQNTSSPSVGSGDEAVALALSLHTYFNHSPNTSYHTRTLANRGDAKGSSSASLTSDYLCMDFAVDLCNTLPNSDDSLSCIVCRFRPLAKPSLIHAFKAAIRSLRLPTEPVEDRSYCNSIEFSAVNVEAKTGGFNGDGRSAGDDWEREEDELRPRSASSVPTPILSPLRRGCTEEHPVSTDDASAFDDLVFPAELSSSSSVLHKHKMYSATQSSATQSSEAIPQALYRSTTGSVVDEPPIVPWDKQRAMSEVGLAAVDVIDTQRKQIEQLQEEVLRLRQLLTKHDIPLSDECTPDCCVGHRAAPESDGDYTNDQSRVIGMEEVGGSNETSIHTSEPTDAPTSYNISNDSNCGNDGASSCDCNARVADSAQEDGLGVSFSQADQEDVQGNGSNYNDNEQKVADDEYTYMHTDISGCHVDTPFGAAAKADTAYNPMRAILSETDMKFMISKYKLRSSVKESSFNSTYSCRDPAHEVREASVCSDEVARTELRAAPGHVSDATAATWMSLSATEPNHVLEYETPSIYETNSIMAIESRYAGLS